MVYSYKFIVGMVLLLTNAIVGWCGILLCFSLFRKTSKRFYCALGSAIYLVSWVMLLLGVLLAGPEGISFAKNTYEAYRWKMIIILVIISTGALLYAWKRKKREEAVFISQKV